MKRYLTFTSVFVLVIQLAIGQAPLKLPETDQYTAKLNYVILSDNCGLKDSEGISKAYQAYSWIIVNAPDMHESIYVFGAKLLKTKIEQEPDNVAFVDELMKCYDMRMEYFGHESQVLNKKAYDAFIYFRYDTSRTNEVVEIFDNLFALEQSKVADNLLYPYFYLKCRELESGRIEKIKLIETYQQISGIIQEKSEQGDVDIEKNQALINNLLIRNIRMECSSLKNILVDYQPNIGMSQQQARLIIMLSLAYECKDEEIFYEALKVIFEEKPTLKLARHIGSYYLGKREYYNALTWLSSALDLADTDQDKSDACFDIAKANYLAGDKIKARKMAYEALKYNSDNKECYRLIGDMYYNSYDECKKGVRRIEDRGVFYAAYEKYALAGDVEKMANAEMQFPTMEDIHTEVFEENQLIQVGCWINESVKIRRRPELKSN